MKCPECDHSVPFSRIWRYTWWTPVICAHCDAKLHYDKASYYKTTAPVIVCHAVLVPMFLVGLMIDIIHSTYLLGSYLLISALFLTKWLFFDYPKIKMVTKQEKVSAWGIRLASIIPIASFACFIGIMQWQDYIDTWKTEVSSLVTYPATIQALNDFREGNLRLLRIDGENYKERFSGQREGPFEVWIVQYFPSLGEPHKYSTEQYMQSYNRKMRYMYEHPEQFQEKEK